ncbi:hypothetical protein GYMLUDRAFT_249356 [Collybiopsis luxurians FD-317 M1]|uniref:Unplaced genomic scaffold GYMLUscaffold_66, whole genome shotgun sequence n=1 Tax=Collybiopsis luxurians FD-317 M1 TaxID=944289 RepID=A0A0D0BXS8_9AGAR|nr:hypothetical protein GYMLUDRAFT_249356 [Collybiopsis luxurians FD-317 M1]
MNSTFTQQVSVAEQIQLQSYFDLPSTTLLFWDHLLTLSDEVQYLWKRPVRPTTALFFLSRYVAVLGNIVMTLSVFSSTFPESRYRVFCIRVISTGNRQFSQLLAISYLSRTPPHRDAGLTLLTIRIYALYHSSRRVLTALVLIASVLVALAIFSAFFGQSNESEEAPLGCHTELSFLAAVKIGAAWEALFLYDVILFAMILYRAYKTRHELQFLRQTKISLLVIVLRDGTVYFGMMAFANAINISTFYVSSSTTVLKLKPSFKVLSVSSGMFGIALGKLKL